MNQWQVAQQVKKLLEGRTWKGTGSVVFAEVFISNRPMRDILSVTSGRIPIAVVRMGDEVHDTDFPEIVLDMGIEVEIAVRVQNDPYGESNLIGGVRTDLTVSEGRGLGEVISQAQETIKNNDSETGISMTSRTTTGTASIRVGNAFYAAKTLDISAKGGVEAFYHPGRLISNSGNTITWTNPPDRFDLNSMILRFAAGATAPASVTAGTGATLAAALSVTFTHAAGAGQFSYALFGGYDYTGNGTNDEFSDSVTFTATF